MSIWRLRWRYGWGTTRIWIFVIFLMIFFIGFIFIGTRFFSLPLKNGRKKSDWSRSKLQPCIEHCSSINNMTPQNESISAFNLVSKAFKPSIKFYRVRHIFWLAFEVFKTRKAGQNICRNLYLKRILFRLFALC